MGSNRQPAADWEKPKAPHKAHQFKRMRPGAVWSLLIKAERGGEGE